MIKKTSKKKHIFIFTICDKTIELTDLDFNIILLALFNEVTKSYFV